MRQPQSLALSGTLCLVWAGMVLGISFLETPVKFTAPSVTLVIGLDVGRHVFGAFNKVEIVLALAACALLLWSHSSRHVKWLLGAVVAVVALQSMWLLPILDARVELILNGQTPPPRPYHLFYIGLELFKVAALLAAGMACWKSLSVSSALARGQENHYVSSLES